MKETGITKQDLKGFEEESSNEEVLGLFNKLSNKEIVETTEIVETELIITDKIEKVASNKKLSSLITQINQVLNTLTSSKETVSELKTQLLKFVSSDNIYCQTAYIKNKVEVNLLLSKLENYSESNTQTDPSNNYRP